MFGASLFSAKLSALFHEIRALPALNFQWYNDFSEPTGSGSRRVHGGRLAYLLFQCFGNYNSLI